MRTLLIVVYPDPFEAIRATAFGVHKRALTLPNKSLALEEISHGIKVNVEGLTDSGPTLFEMVCRIVAAPI
jgi:hypothetical protein